MNKDQRKIGERLEDLMKEKNITSKELSKLVSAKGVKLSEATLSDIINNVDKGYSYKIFVEISKQLGVSTDYLFGLSDVATNNTELKAVCHYTGLDEKSVKILNGYVVKRYDDILSFACDMIIFTNDNISPISQFICSKNLLFELYDEEKQDKAEYIDSYSEWKQTNDLLFATSQFKLQSAFNRYINSERISEAVKYFDDIENEYIKVEIKKEKELDQITKLAKAAGYVYWFDFIESKNLTSKEEINKFLLNQNLNISDSTVEYIELMMRHSL